jgi:hypothetical protein
MVPKKEKRGGKRRREGEREREKFIASQEVTQGR